MFDKDSLIADLKRAHSQALALSVPHLADQIIHIGFQCLGCGQCCQGEDNSVIVFPFEIRRIMAKTDLDWLETVQPPEEGEWDSDGNFHTLEWRLKKAGQSCRFFVNGMCAIYASRPLLCQTYPFYLNEGELSCSECPGLGMEIKVEAAEDLARQLIMRHITEIEEAIALTERYEDFERGSHGDDGDCIVHDSEGKSRVPRFIAPRSSPHQRSYR